MLTCLQPSEVHRPETDLVMVRERPSRRLSGNVDIKPCGAYRLLGSLRRGTEERSVRHVLRHRAELSELSFERVAFAIEQSVGHRTKQTT